MCRIIADVTGCTLEIPHMQSSDVTSLGAAIIAGEAVGMLSRDEVNGFGVIDAELVTTDSAVRQTYDSAYSTYAKLYPAIRDLF